MTQARWTPEALRDFEAFDLEFQAIDPDYADRVGRRALEAARMLAEFPKAGPVLDRRCRKWRVTATDYVLLYRPVPGGVDILRMQHARADWRPRGWRRRP
jgi:toxin ParE1/3/4